MTIQLEASHDLDRWVLTFTDEVERREVWSVEDMRRLLADRGGSFTEQQHHGLGLVTALLALGEYGRHHSADKLGKLLDAVYFPASNPDAGRAFSRGLGKGLFALRRAETAQDVIATLLGDASRDFSEPAAM